jgi:hypothetical protein
MVLAPVEKTQRPANSLKQKLIGHQSQGLFSQQEQEQQEHKSGSKEQPTSLAPPHGPLVRLCQVPGLQQRLVALARQGSQLTCLQWHQPWFCFKQW